MDLGLLFDLDGTMVLSDPIHLAALRAMLAEQGKTLSEDEYFRRLSGGANPAVMRQLFPEMGTVEHVRLADRKEELFRGLTTNIEPVRGLHQFLDRARCAGIKIGVVTNAPRLNAEHLLQAIGLEQLLDTIIIGVELPRAKPDPLPFLAGLERMGLPSSSVLAFEDSLNGVRSAVAAGLFTVGIRTGLDNTTLRSVGATFTVEDYEHPVLLDLMDRAAKTGMWFPS